MIKIGQYNELIVLKETSSGVYLEGGDWGDIFLPKKFVPKSLEQGQIINVFLYIDSENRVVATTLKPGIVVGEFALLTVNEVNRVGAFLDWGLDKELLVPRSLQQRPMQQGHSYLVYACLDEKSRIIASSKIEHYLDNSAIKLRQGDQVNLLVAETSPLGRKVIINHRHWGLIHANELFQNLSYGQTTVGYIKKIREDNKIDVVLRKTGQDNIHDLSLRIKEALQEAGGFLPLHDKSSAAEIMKIFNESKKNFKRAIGQLYKAGDIVITENGIRLLS
ncbi:MAG: S1 RNA-binding domain-containing protein [Legionella sp.]